MHVQFGSIFNGSREVFMGHCRAAWLAKQCVDIVDSEMDIKLW